MTTTKRQQRWEKTKQTITERKKERKKEEPKETKKQTNTQRKEYNEDKN